MNPFLEVPIGKDAEDREIIARIKPGEIEYYYPEPGTCNSTNTLIGMCSGGIVRTTWTFMETDQAITAYVHHLKKNPGTFGNLMINLKPKLPDMIALKPEPKLEPEKS